MFNFDEYRAVMDEPRDVTIPRLWIHLGADTLHMEQFRPIHNSYGFNKPLGGIWVSPLHLADDSVSDWQRASRNMGFEQPTTACVVEFKKDAKIYVIDTHADLVRLANEVGVQQPPFETSSMYLRMKTLDFVKVAEKYDAIYLTDRGEFSTRIPFIGSEYNLYGWDCECSVILNFDAIARQHRIKLNKRK